MKILVIGLLVLFSFVWWQINSADHYTLNSLTYERVEPEKEWRNNDYVIFSNNKGEKIKYLCPSYIYESMIYGTTYDVTIIDGDFALPSTKVSRVVPAD